MKGLELLDWFFTKVSSDARISTGHLGLYCAILQMWQDQGMEDGVQMFAKELMDKAKISSTATYYRLISDLNNYGYLKYIPSFYKKKPSRIILGDIMMKP